MIPTKEMNYGIRLMTGNETMPVYLGPRWNAFEWEDNASFFPAAFIKKFFAYPDVSTGVHFLN